MFHFSYISFKWAKLHIFHILFPLMVFGHPSSKKKKPGNFNSTLQAIMMMEGKNLGNMKPNAGVFPPNLNPLNAGKKNKKNRPIRWSQSIFLPRIEKLSLKQNTSVANEGPTRVAQRPLRKKKQQQRYHRYKTKRINNKGIYCNSRLILILWFLESMQELFICTISSNHHLPRSNHH